MAKGCNHSDSPLTFYFSSVFHFSVLHLKTETDTQTYIEEGDQDGKV